MLGGSSRNPFSYHTSDLQPTKQASVSLNMYIPLPTKATEKLIKPPNDEIKTTSWKKSLHSGQKTRETNLPVTLGLISACEALNVEAAGRQVLHHAGPKGATTHAPCVPPLYRSAPDSERLRCGCGSSEPGCHSSPHTASSPLRSFLFFFFFGAFFFEDRTVSYTFLSREDLCNFPYICTYLYFFFLKGTRQRGASVYGHPRTPMCGNPPAPERSRPGSDGSEERRRRRSGERGERGGEAAVAARRAGIFPVP